MKISELSNTSLRFITSICMFLVIAGAVLLEKYGIPFLHIHAFHAIRWLSVLAVIAAMIEFGVCLFKTGKDTFQKRPALFSLFAVLLILMLISAYTIGARPFVMLWLLMIIVGADVGAWLFGSIFGGDKMWEKVSSHKTWSGQIGGIICGMLMSILYYKMFGGFLQNAVFVGISVALLSQYGDLTASFIKRQIGIKDFSNVLPGHGGVLDRIDGWMYVLPLIWLIIS